MILHLDTQRDPDGALDKWLGIQTEMLGYMLTERVIVIENQPERMLAVITNVGHAARAIERKGSLKHNKIYLEDDRDQATGKHEQFEVFEMLADRRKKMLVALGGNYAKYLAAVISLVRYWSITIGLMSNEKCANPDCRMSLEVYNPKCVFCGVPNNKKWR